MAFLKSRKKFGHALGEGKVEQIGDNRYGLREAYDPKVKAETIEFYNTGHDLTVTEIKNPNAEVIQTVKLRFKE